MSRGVALGRGGLPVSLVRVAAAPVEPGELVHYMNSTEESYGGDLNVLVKDDFNRGWWYKANTQGYLDGTSGTRLFTGPPEHPDQHEFTAGWEGTLFSQAIPADLSEAAALGQDGILVKDISGSSDIGTQYAATHGEQPGTGANYMGTHNFKRPVEAFYLRFYAYFEPGYQFGAEKICTINEFDGGTSGIIWGNLHINRAAGSAQATGNLGWQGVSSGSGSTSHNTSVELEPGRWYVIQLHLDKTGGPGAGIVRIWCDDLGPDGTDVPGSPTLVLERTTYTFVDAADDGNEEFGSAFMESWANPGSDGEWLFTNFMVIEEDGPIPFRSAA